MLSYLRQSTHSQFKNVLFLKLIFRSVKFCRHLFCPNITFVHGSFKINVYNSKT
jgi:hypothetical protein